MFFKKSSIILGIFCNVSECRIGGCVTFAWWCRLRPWNRHSSSGIRHQPRRKLPMGVSGTIWWFFEIFRRVSVSGMKLQMVFRPKNRESQELLAKKCPSRLKALLLTHPRRVNRSLWRMWPMRTASSRKALICQRRPQFRQPFKELLNILRRIHSPKSETIKYSILFIRFFVCTNFIII